LAYYEKTINFYRYGIAFVFWCDKNKINLKNKL